ncbi:MAG: leucyl/phenylalanyl-tRNA--protein transferase [Thermoguttaceae bacterium]
MSAKIPPSLIFPPVEEADDDGLLALGGELEPPWLLDAYMHGIFPWPFGDDSQPMAWWSPDPRGILELDDLHISRRLRRTLRQGGYRVTCDRAFAQVMAACAVGPGRQGGTWVTPAMIRAYTQLHHLQFAHSLEVWFEQELVGGTYGVSIRGLFAAESKFYRRRDASKVALAHLVTHLKRRGYRLLDLQMVTPHTGRLGAVEIPRDEYLRRLAVALEQDVTFGDRLLVEPGDF